MLTLIEAIGCFILTGILYEGLVVAQLKDQGVTETPSEIIKYIHGETNENVGAKGASVVDGGLRLRQSKDKGGLILFLHDNTYNEWSFEYTISDIDLHFPEQGGVYLWYTKYDQDMGQYRGGDGHFEGLMAGIEFKGMSPEIVYVYSDGDILDEYGEYSLHRDSFEPSRLKGVKDLTVKDILTANNFKVELYDNDRLLYDSFRYVHDHPFKTLGVDKRFSITSYYANTSSEKAFKLVKAQLYKRVESAEYDAEKVHALHESSLPQYEHEVKHPNKEMRAFIAQFTHFIEYVKGVLGDVDNPLIAKTSQKIIEKIEEGNDSSFRHTISNKINEMDRRLQLIYKQMSEMHHIIHELERKNANTSNVVPYIVLAVGLVLCCLTWFKEYQRQTVRSKNL